MVQGAADLEPLFDVTDLQSRRESTAIQSQPVSKCGQLEIAFAYDAPGRKMTVHILQARDVPTKDRGGSSHTQVRFHHQSNVNIHNEYSICFSVKI